MDNFGRRMEAYFKQFKEEFNGKNEISSSENKEFSMEENIRHIGQVFAKKWETGYDYSKVKHKIYSSVPMNPHYIMGSNVKFDRILLYIEALYDSLDKTNYIIPDLIQNELTEWEIRGGLCIYLSVLLYSMIVYEKLCCTSCMKFVQGLATHEIRKDYPSFMPWNGRHVLLHSWIILGGSIIDFAIKQQYPFFDFKNTLYVMGNIPEGLTYAGFEETKETVEKYIEEILQFSEISFTDWIKTHYYYSILVMLESLRD